MNGTMILAISSTNSQMLWGTTEKGGKVAKFYIYDKNKKRTSFFSWNEIVDDLTFCDYNARNGMLGILPMNDSNDDCFISYIDAGILKEKAEEKGLLSTPPYDKLKDISDGSNPAIIRIRFK